MRHAIQSTTLEFIFTGLPQSQAFYRRKGSGHLSCSPGLKVTRQSQACPVATHDHLLSQCLEGKNGALFRYRNEHDVLLPVAPVLNVVRAKLVPLATIDPVLKIRRLETGYGSSLSLFLGNNFALIRPSKELTNREKCIGSWQVQYIIGSRQATR